MDFTGTASGGRALIRYISLSIILCAVPLFGQDSADDLAAKAKQLIAEERWTEVVALAKPVSQPSAELEYYYGTALARLELWDAARAAFAAGARLKPADERFPLELAGVAFKQKRYSAAVTYLHRALAIAPEDSYAADFLATVYFLQGNLEAALKYWNRTGKPKIEAVRAEPETRLNPVLLDHALAFTPGDALQLPELLTSGARLRGLGIFLDANFDLLAREDGKYDVGFHNHELNGFGSNKFEALIRVFRNLPAQTVNPEYFNWHGRAVNFVSMYRWDAQKRRVRAEVSSPWRGEPKRRFSFGVDLRDENWDIRNSFTANVPPLASLNMRREAATAQLTSFPNGRWQWSVGGEVSHRDFRDVFLGSTLTPGLVTRGYQLKQLADVNVDILRIPEHRMTVNAGLSSQAGRIWSDPTHGFEKLQTAWRFHWLPQATGDDYEVQQQVRAGKTWGDPPFDELFTLGGLGDNDLIMRGHITTHDGRKGSGPLGRNYFLSNSEVDKNVFHNGLVNIKVGPFLDTGKITDSTPGMGPQKWLWDTGGQVKVRAFGLGVALSYGRDLRSGNEAIFVTMLW